MAVRVLMGFDGEVRDPSKPSVFADDLGILRGDGLFETLLVREGRACALDAHLARLQTSTDLLDLPVVDCDQLGVVIDRACRLWGTESEARLRVVYTRGCEGGADATGYVLVDQLPMRVIEARGGNVSAMTLARGYSVSVGLAPWLLRGAKTLSFAMNMAAIRYANGEGADEVIFTSTDGFVLESPRASVLAVIDGRLVTPPIEHGVLPGTTVAALFAHAASQGIDCAREPLTVADLHTADGVWLLSSMTIAARVRSLDGQRLADSAIDVYALADAAISP